MEGGGGEGAGIVVVGRRLTLLDQMSTVQDRHTLTGLTLDAVLSGKRAALPSSPPTPPPPPGGGRTLLDIIRNEDPSGKNLGHKDRRSWKLFRDKLRLRRAGAAWTSSVRIPASDVNIQSSSATNPRSQLLRRSSVRFQTNPAGEAIAQQGESVDATNSRPQFTRRSSVRVASMGPFQAESTQPESDSVNVPMPQDAPPANSLRPQMGRRNSTRIPQSSFDMEENCVDPFEVAREGTRRLAVALAEERALSAREAVAAQEAADAEAARAEAEAAAEAEESASVETQEQAAPSEQPPALEVGDPQSRMSLMDLLEETDRQMGVEGSKYTEADEEEEEDDVEEDEAGQRGGDGGMEYTCCVCMVRHKGAAFIPCGHTFCRLCSRELWVQRGNCPLCNNFIVEILDIF